MRLEPREKVSYLFRTMVPVMAGLAALLFCSALIIWAGASPVEAFALFIKGSTGSKFAISETLTRTIP